MALTDFETRPRSPSANEGVAGLHVAETLAVLSKIVMNSGNEIEQIKIEDFLPSRA